jgi:AraC family transcriptional regulator
MRVEIVEFPATKVAVIEHRGSPALEHDTANKLIAWKLEKRFLDPLRYRSYGLHYTDPRTTPLSDHRVDFCLSVDEDVGPNSYGVIDKTIPAARCARARDIGSRLDNRAAAYLANEWLPRSGESASGLPTIFHYVNVGPTIRADDMITDVYLPLK